MHLTLSLINGVVSTGEITMKLKQPWKSEFTNHASPAYQILAGNLATAVRMSVPVFYLPATLLLHFPPPPPSPLLRQILQATSCGLPRSLYYTTLLRMLA